MNRKNKNRKRIVSLLLAAVTVISALSFSSCGNDRKLLDSTKEDLTVIGNVGGFDVPLELYRYVALNTREDFDHGDSSVWIGEDGIKLLDSLNSAVDETIVRLYTTLAICEDYGIHADDGYIVDAVNAAMEHIYGNYSYDYKAYINDISAHNMNDSVYRFLVRNDIMGEELLAKMIALGEIPEYSEDFVSVAQSDAFVRVKQILVSSDSEKTEEERLEKIGRIKARLDNGTEFDTVLWEDGEDIFLFNNPDGYYISRGSFHTKFEDEAFSLAVGETGDIIQTPAGYSIVKRYEKEDSFIMSHLDDLYETYRDGLYNLALEKKNGTLSAEWNDKKEKYTVFTMNSSK